MAIGIWITVPESNVHINSQEQKCTLDHLESELQALCSRQVVQKCYHTVGYPLNMQIFTEIYRFKYT
jgi:hypothetical protein